MNLELKHIPLLGRLSKTQREVLAYLAVGGWNTLFGMLLYSIGYWLWGKQVHYLLLAILVNIIAITNAFLCYKFLVFKTKGNWLREYLRCYIVYGGGCLISMALLWLLKEFLNMNPVVANALATLIVVICSYFGHKYFSFRKHTKEGNTP
ncbi:MAG: GtrA family protein [Victivallales bacterium]|nr:GtrA family protein [Victivallales bacterium]